MQLGYASGVCAVRPDGGRNCDCKEEIMNIASNHFKPIWAIEI